MSSSSTRGLSWKLLFQASVLQVMTVVCVLESPSRCCSLESWLPRPLLLAGFQTSLVFQSPHSVCPWLDSFVINYRYVPFCFQHPPQHTHSCSVFVYFGFGDYLHHNLPINFQGSHNCVCPTWYLLHYTVAIDMSVCLTWMLTIRGLRGMLTTRAYDLITMISSWFS